MSTKAEHGVGVEVVILKVCREARVYKMFEEFAQAGSEGYGAQVVNGNRFVGFRNESDVGVLPLWWEGAIRPVLVKKVENGAERIVVKVPENFVGDAVFARSCVSREAGKSFV